LTAFTAALPDGYAARVIFYTKDGIQRSAVGATRAAMLAINVTDYAFVAMALVGHLGTQLTGANGQKL
jgi:hypothetical protein